MSRLRRRLHNWVLRHAPAPPPSGPMIYRRVADGASTRGVLRDGEVVAESVNFTMAQEPPSPGSDGLRRDGEVASYE